MTNKKIKKALDKLRRKWKGDTVHRPKPETNNTPVDAPPHSSEASGSALVEDHVAISSPAIEVDTLVASSTERTAANLTSTSRALDTETAIVTSDLDQRTTSMRSVRSEQVLLSDAAAKQLSLWDEAYQALRHEDERLVDAFEEALLTFGAEGTETASRTDGRRRHERIQSLARDKLEGLSNERLRFSVLGKELIIRDQLKKALKFILNFKEIVTTAISANQGAALAWSGALVGLQMLSTSFQQEENALDGFEYLSSLLIRFELMERTPFSVRDDAQRALVGTVRDETIKLYTIVLHYEIDLVRHYSRGRAARVLKDFIGLLEWKEYRANIEKLDEGISKNVNLLNSKEIQEKLNSVKQQFEKVENEIKKMHQEVEHLTEAVLMEKLYREFVGDAVFIIESSLEGQNPRCIDGTQGSTLKAIEDWYYDDQGEAVFWLSSMSGTGKSTIARTVAAALSLGTNLSDNGEARTDIFLGGSFFFRQNVESRNTPKGLCATLATCLANGQPTLRSLITKSLGNLNMGSGLQILWKSLILDPLSDFGSKLQERSQRMRLIVIIDALDECKFDSIGAVKHLLGLLCQPLGQGRGSIQLRYLVTSRDERNVKEAFGGLSQKQAKQVRHFGMGKVPISSASSDFIADNDILLFLRNELPHIAKQRFPQISETGHPEEWTEENLEKTIEKLCRKSEGLFIYASTCCRFLDDPRAKCRLHTIFDDNNDERTPQGKLFDMYNRVLRSSVQSWTMTERQGLMVILAHLATSPETVGVSVLEKLLPNLGIRDLLADLHSVIGVPKDDSSPVSLIHASFQNFLLDKGIKERPNEFWVDANKTHFKMFKRCLEIMQDPKLLQQDICKVVLPGSTVSQTSKDKVQEHIPLHLHYACRHWVNHLEQAHTSLADPTSSHKIRELVYNFLSTSFLYWLEALAWMEEMPASISMIRKLRSLFPEPADTHKAVSEVDRLPAFLYDAHRFVLSNRSIIETAPLQTYSSALIFAPSQSIVRCLFEKDHVPDWVVKPPNVPEKWSTELFLIEEGVEIHKFGIPSKKDIFISTSTKGSFCTWDLATGAVLATFNLDSPECFIDDMAIAPDGAVLACAVSNWGSYGWDDSSVIIVTVATGEPEHLGQHRHISKVAFSPDGRMVVSTSPEEGTLKLWDVGTKRLLRVNGLSGTASLGTESQHWVEFSPDGDRVAYATANGNISIRGVHNDSLDVDLNAQVRLRGFFWSKSGEHLGLTTIHYHDDEDIPGPPPQDWYTRSWDLSTKRKVLNEDFGAHFISSLPSMAVSLSGHALALGEIQSNGKYGLLLWNMSTNEEVSRLNLPDDDLSQQLSEFAHTADGRIVVLVIENCRLDVHDLTSQSDAAGNTDSDSHPDFVYVVHLSPDRSFLCTYSMDHELCEGHTKIWHVASRTSKMAGVDELSNNINTVMFSPNSQYVVFGTVEDPEPVVWIIALDSWNTAWLSTISHEAGVSTLPGDVRSEDLRIYPFEGFHTAIFSTCSDFIALKSDTDIQIINLESMATVKVFPLTNETYDRGMFLLGKSQTIGWVTEHNGGALHLYNMAEDCEWVHELDFLHAYPSNPKSSSPDGQLIPFRSMEHGYCIWDVSTASIKAQAAASSAMGFRLFVCDPVFSNDSEYFADIVSEHRGPIINALFVDIWQTATGHHICQFGPMEYEGSHAEVKLSFTSKNEILAVVISSSKGNFACLWDMATKVMLANLEMGSSLGVNTLDTFNISFSDTCPHMNTQEGNLPLPTSSDGFPALSECSAHCAHVWFKGEWLAQGSENLLWVPSAYRPSGQTSRDDLIVTGGVNGRVNFLEVDHSKTPIAEEIKNGRCVFNCSEWK